MRRNLNAASWWEDFHEIMLCPASLFVDNLDDFTLTINVKMSPQFPEPCNNNWAEQIKLDQCLAKMCSF